MSNTVQLPLFLASSLLKSISFSVSLNISKLASLSSFVAYFEDSLIGVQGDINTVVTCHDDQLSQFKTSDFTSRENMIWKSSKSASCRSGDNVLSANSPSSIISFSSSVKLLNVPAIRICSGECQCIVQLSELPQGQRHIWSYL